MIRRLPSLLAAWFALFVAAPARPVAAEAEPVVRLRFEAPANLRCPPEDAFRRGVAERLGFDAFDEARDIEASVVFRREARGLRASVSLTRLSTGEVLGMRELRRNDARCAELSEMAVLAVAIAIDTVRAEIAPPSPAQGDADAHVLASEEASRGATAETATELSVTQDGQYEDVTPGDLSPSDAEVGAWRIVLALAVGVSWGTLPGVTPTALLRVEAWRAALGFGVEPFVLPYSALTIAGQREIQSFAAGARALACMRAEWFDGCATVSLADVRSWSSEVGAPQADARFAAWAGLSARARVDVTPHAALFVALSADLPLARPSIEVEGERVFRASVIAPRAEVGALVRF